MLDVPFAIQFIEYAILAQLLVAFAYDLAEVLIRHLTSILKLHVVKANSRHGQEPTSVSGLIKVLGFFFDFAPGHVRDELVVVADVSDHRIELLLAKW